MMGTSPGPGSMDLWKGRPSLPWVHVKARMMGQLLGPGSWTPLSSLMRHSSSGARMSILRSFFEQTFESCCLEVQHTYKYSLAVGF